jgi:hypothetical protein
MAVRQISMDSLAVGMTAHLQICSPVRKWMVRHRGGGEKWLTPVGYVPRRYPTRGARGEAQYILVRIARAMLPYVIAFAREDGDRVALWIDTREVRLFAAE